MDIICIICYDNLMSEDIVIGTSCGHLFHGTCLRNWIKRSRSCPQCRCLMQESSGRQFYLNCLKSDLAIDLKNLSDTEGFISEIVKGEMSMVMQIWKSRNIKLRGELEASKNLCKELQQSVKSYSAETTRLKKKIAKSAKENIVSKKRITELEEINKSRRWENVAEMLSAKNDPASVIDKIVELKGKFTTTMEQCNKLTQCLSNASKRLLNESKKSMKTVTMLEVSVRECNLETSDCFPSVPENNKERSKKKNTVPETSEKSCTEKVKATIPVRQLRSSVARAPVGTIDRNTENALQSKRYNLRPRCHFVS